MTLCALTCKCSKCVRGQFPEDDWVGGPVSLEHLRETKKLWYDFFLFHHWCSQVWVAMFICIHLGHCHIHLQYWKIISKTYVCMYLITYKSASLTVFRLTENLVITLTLCGKILSRASPLSPPASSSFLASSVVLPLMRASVWARKFATRIYNHVQHT